MFCLRLCPASCICYNCNNFGWQLCQTQVTDIDGQTFSKLRTMKTLYPELFVLELICYDDNDKGGTWSEFGCCLTLLCINIYFFTILLNKSLTLLFGHPSSLTLHDHVYQVSLPSLDWSNFSQPRLWPIHTQDSRQLLFLLRNCIAALKNFK